MAHNTITRVICVVDDTAQRGSRLRSEHGLAFLVESEAGHVLLDTGLSGTVLLHNLNVLDIDPRSIDALVISHGHNDHTGGLPALLEQTRPKIPLYAHPGLFQARFSLRGVERDAVRVSLPMDRDALASRTTLHLSAEPQEVLPGIWSTGEITFRPEPEGGSPHHVVRTEAGGWVRDPYRDDMSLLLMAGSGMILLCGCCHAGLLNTLAHVQHQSERSIVAIAGGTHLVSADADSLRHVCQVVAEMGSLRRIYLNHCSGDRAIHALRLALGSDVVRACPAGTWLDEEILR